MNWYLTAVLCWCAMTQSQGAEGNETLFDRTVRYVNEQSLTLGDVRTRVWERMQELQRSGKPVPSEAGLLVFAQETLELLTDEELLVQYGQRFAEARKFRLVDHEQIRRRVQDTVARSGGNMSLQQQTDLGKSYEREQMVGIVLESIFYPRAALITEAEINDAYQQRRALYSMPARIKACEIVFRATDEAERTHIHGQKLTLFKDVQEQLDQRVRHAAESRFDAFLAAKPADQKRILDEMIIDLVAEAGREGIDRRGMDIIAQAQLIQKNEASFRDLEGAKAQLEELRLQLVGKGVDAFKDAARRLSQGPNKEQGGDLVAESGGWLEPGRYSPAVDEHAFAGKAGEISPVFVVDHMACMVLVTEREDARVRSLKEVRGDVEVALEREQKNLIRINALAMLRSKASIKDIVPFNKLME